MAKKVLSTKARKKQEIRRELCLVAGLIAVIMLVMVATALVKRGKAEQIPAGQYVEATDPDDGVIVNMTEGSGDVVVDMTESGERPAEESPAEAEAEPAAEGSEEVPEPVEEAEETAAEG